MEAPKDHGDKDLIWNEVTSWLLKCMQHQQRSDEINNWLDWVLLPWFFQHFNSCLCVRWIEIKMKFLHSFQLVFAILIVTVRVSKQRSPPIQVSWKMKWKNGGEMQRSEFWKLPTQHFFLRVSLGQMLSSVCPSWSKESFNPYSTLLRKKNWFEIYSSYKLSTYFETNIDMISFTIG